MEIKDLIEGLEISDIEILEMGFTFNYYQGDFYLFNHNNLVLWLNSKTKIITRLVRRV